MRWLSAILGFALVAISGMIEEAELGIMDCDGKARCTTLNALTIRFEEHESDQQIADSRNGYQDVFPLPSCVLQVRQRWPLRRGLLQQ
jgi:hypothetical protein